MFRFYFLIRVILTIFLYTCFLFSNMVPCIKTNVLSVFLLILFVFAPLAGASGPTVREAEPYKAPADAFAKQDLFSVLCVKAELYNEQSDDVPMLLQKFVGSEQIALRIKLDNGNMLYATVRMAGGKVIGFYSYDTQTDPNSKFEPSIIVESNEQTVRRILDSSNPLKEAVNCMNEDSLKVEAKGVFLNAELWTLRQLYSS